MIQQPRTAFGRFASCSASPLLERAYPDDDESTDDPERTQRPPQTWNATGVLILARDAPIGVIFRRGPTIWTQVIRWNIAKAAATLRVEVIGILNRLRKNLALEMKDDPSLPRDLEGYVFGYLDMLEKTCAEARAKGAEVEEIPPPPEATSGTGP